jgi:endonuclease YncB( thermonuclease family)
MLFYAYNRDGESIDETLVREGLALAWPEDGQHRDVLLAAEERARENQVGCWKSASPTRGG